MIVQRVDKIVYFDDISNRVKYEWVCIPLVQEIGNIVLVNLDIMDYGDN
jgi:hypothetical protein